MFLMSADGLAPGDGSKAFPFQFGSISPGFMNGMQVLFYPSILAERLLFSKCSMIYISMLRIDEFCYVVL